MVLRLSFGVFAKIDFLLRRKTKKETLSFPSRKMLHKKTFLRNGTNERRNLWGEAINRRFANKRKEKCQGYSLNWRLLPFLTIPFVHTHTNSARESHSTPSVKSFKLSLNVELTHIQLIRNLLLASFRFESFSACMRVLRSWKFRWLLQGCFRNFYRRWNISKWW